MNKDKQKKEISKISKDELNNEIKKSFKSSKNIENPKVKNEKKESKSDENLPKITKIENFINKRYELRLDEVKNIIEVRKINTNEPFEKNENFESNLSVELMRSGFKAFKQELSALLSSSYFIKRYHPIREYFNKLPKWDKKDRIKELTDYINVHKNEKELFHLHFKKHLVRCVESAFVPNFFNKHCFVIVGTQQNMGKTSFIRYLVPNELKGYYTDYVGDWRDKDAQISMACNWFNNLDELANLDRDSINSMKSNLSRTHIKVRRPYEKNESEIPRLANFWGSTNEVEFLSDLTGNVRFICFRIFNIDFKYSEIDINQLWAQCFYEFKNKFESRLTKEEERQNDLRNDSFMITNVEVEAIQEYFLPYIPGFEYENVSGEKLFASTSELMAKINEKGKYRFTNQKRFGQALTKLNFERVTERLKASIHPKKGVWYYEYTPEIEQK